MSEINSLLIVRPDRVGDVLVSSACLPAVREAFPQAKLFFGARAVMEPLFKEHPLLEGFVAFDADPELQKSIESFHAVAVDAVLFLQPEPVLYEAAKAVGIARRVGYADKGCEGLLTDELPYDKSEGKMLEAEYSFDLLNVLDVQQPELLSESIQLPASVIEDLNQSLKGEALPDKFVAFHLTAYSPYLRWPVDRFVQVALEMEEEFPLDVVLVGTPDEVYDEFLELFNRRNPDPTRRCINLAGATSLSELGEVLRRAECLVTRNSGPSHLASAVGCPVVDLFARLEPHYGPARWRTLSSQSRNILAKPPKRRWWEVKKWWWKRCLETITVDEVSEALGDVLREKLHERSG